MPLELRQYQSASIKALYAYWSAYKGNPLIVLPTGAGKSVVIADFVHRALTDWPDTRIIIATHSRELISQNYVELIGLWPEAPAGVYSAGLNRRDTHHKILFVGIQSAYTKAYTFQRCDILIIDESHTISRKADTMWGQFIRDLRVINPKMKVLGLSATPFRMDSGLLTEGDDSLFSDVAYEYSILKAIQEGYLCEIIPKHMETGLDVSAVHKRGGEFVAGELERAVNVDATTNAAIDEVIRYGQNRRTWLLFCSGVQHSEAVAGCLRAKGVECAVITGETPAAERDGILRDFRSGRLRAVANNNVMTTGTNVKNIDLIAGLRPTGSAGLHIQMLGRGMRPLYADGADLGTQAGRLHGIKFGPKPNCLYLDFSRNVNRFGPLDQIRARKPGKGGGDAPVRVCEVCQGVCFAGCRICPDCQNTFPEPELKISKTGDSAPIFSTQIEPVWHNVIGMTQTRHEKEGKPPSMRVTYYTMTGRYSEWICFQHTGFARDKAAKWHKHRSTEPLPKTVEDALNICYPQPTRIQVRDLPNKFQEVCGYDWESVKEQAIAVENSKPADIWNPADEEYEIPF